MRLRLRLTLSLSLLSLVVPLRPLPVLLRPGLTGGDLEDDGVSGLDASLGYRFVFVRNVQSLQL